MVDDVSSGIGGERHVRMARAASLEIGENRLPAPLVTVSESDSYSVKTYAGAIGASALKHFRVAFDYGHRKLYLAPGANPQASVPADASGLRLRATGASFQTIEVVSVARGSPAEQAGVLAGDELVAVNGQTGLVLEDLRSWFCQPEQDYRLEIRRAGHILEISLRTKPLL